LFPQGNSPTDVVITTVRKYVDCFIATIAVVWDVEDIEITIANRIDVGMLQRIKKQANCHSSATFYFDATVH
jgi:hypothetical protein